MISWKPQETLTNLCHPWLPTVSSACYILSCSHIVSQPIATTIMGQLVSILPLVIVECPYDPSIRGQLVSILPLVIVECPYDPSSIGLAGFYLTPGRCWVPLWPPVWGASHAPVCPHCCGGPEGHTLTVSVWCQPGVCTTAPAGAPESSTVVSTNRSHPESSTVASTQRIH